MGRDMLNAAKYITTVPFSRLFNWSVQYLNDSKIAFNKKYPMMRIGEFLTRSKNAVTIQNDIKYARVTIKVRNGGVFKRDEVMGESIGTKKQYRVSAGQFILSKIDARNGAMGIVPQELNGAVVTQDFLPYDIDTEKINPQYLVLVSTTQQFMSFCQSCSSGTTNRQRIDETQFLNIKVPVPSLKEQKILVSRYIKEIAQATQLDNQIIEYEKKIETYLLETLGINSCTQEKIVSSEYKFLKFVNFSNVERWDIWNSKKAIQSSYFQCKSLSNVIIGHPKYGAGYKTNKSFNGVRYIRITDINEDGTLNDEKVSAKGFDVQYVLKQNDFLIARSGNTVGKTFLYDEQYGKAIYAGYLIKFVLNESIINPHYLLYYTKSLIYKQWINSSMRVSAQPNINSQQYLESPIILPRLEIQNKIVKHITSRPLKR